MRCSQLGIDENKSASNTASKWNELPKRAKISVLFQRIRFKTKANKSSQQKVAILPENVGCTNKWRSEKDEEKKNAPLEQQQKNCVVCLCSFYSG